MTQEQDAKAIIADYEQKRKGIIKEAMKIRQSTLRRFLGLLLDPDEPIHGKALREKANRRTRYDYILCAKLTFDILNLPDKRIILELKRLIEKKETEKNFR